MTWYWWRFLNYIKSLCVKVTRYSQRFLNYIIKWQNVPIFPNYVNEKHYSVKIGSFSFFSSFTMQKFHNLLGYHTIVISSSLIFFLKHFAFFQFNMPSKKSDNIFIGWKKLSWLDLKLKQYAWQKNFLNSY